LRIPGSEAAPERFPGRCGRSGGDVTTEPGRTPDAGPA
jgi:hypothetical protein